MPTSYLERLCNSFPKKNVTKVSSWKDAISVLFDKDIEYVEEYQRYRNTRAYRGLDSVTFELTTTLQRNYLNKTKIEEIEHVFLRNFRKYIRETPGQYKPELRLELLSLAQHHGVPTRMLDWTLSPLVALYFATRNEELYDQDSYIWCIDYDKVNKKLPAGFTKHLNLGSANLFSIDILEQIRKSHENGKLDIFEVLARTEDKSHPYALFFEPPSFDYRIINQNACFSITSSSTVRLDRILREHYPEAVKVIVIETKGDRRVKRRIADYLHKANITERILFPGLDGIAAGLKQRYGPRCPADDVVNLPGYVGLEDF